MNEREKKKKKKKRIAEMSSARQMWRLVVRGPKRPETKVRVALLAPSGKEPRKDSGCEACHFLRFAVHVPNGDNNNHNGFCEGTLSYLYKLPYSGTYRGS